jgi:hypothetical protein
MGAGPDAKLINTFTLMAEAGLAQLVDGVQEARHEMLTFFPLKPNSLARSADPKSSRTVQFSFSLPCDGCWIVGNPEAISNFVRGECAARSAFGIYSLVYL